jgi:hypothetical protein
MDFKKGDKVGVLDFPFGKPLNIQGIIVGRVGKNYYNVRLESGLLEGDIVKYKYWKLFPVDKVEEI